MHIEGFQALQHGKANAAGGDGADMHAFDVIGALDAVGDVPAALHHPLIGRNVIAHEREDHHDHMLGDADRIAEGDFGDCDTLVHRRLKIGVIGADSRSDHEFKFRRLGEPRGGHVGRPERLRNNDLRIRQLAIEDRIRAILIGGHDQFVALEFEVFAQAQFARHAAKKGAGLKIDRFRRRKSLTVRIASILGRSSRG